MANSKISELTTVISVNGTDLLPIVQGSGTSKITKNVRIDQLPQYAGKIDTTVADLRMMAENDQLKPGSFYAFDFTTKYVIPNTESTQYPKGEIGIGWTERILVMALSENSLAPEAYSMDYPEDILSIDIFDDVCEDDDTPRDGKITYRKDTVRNLETWYDFRNVRFRRWQIDISQYQVWADDTTYSEGNLVKYNDVIYKCKEAHLSQGSMNFLKWEKIFYVGEIYMVAWDKQMTFSSTLLPVKTESHFDYLTFDASSISNVKILPTDNGSYNNIVIHEEVPGDLHIGYNSKNMTINGYSKGNWIGSDCEEIILTGTQHNTIGNACKKVQLHGSMFNFLDRGCQNSIIYGNFNKIGASCYSLKLHYSSYNQIDSGCWGIQIGGGCNANTFGPTCFNINLMGGHMGSGNFVQNSFGAGCSNITLIGNGNIFQNGCSSIIIQGSANDSFFAAGVRNKTFSSVSKAQFLVSDSYVVNFTGSVSGVIDKAIGLKYYRSYLQIVGGEGKVIYQEIDSI